MLLFRSFEHNMASRGARMTKTQKQILINYLEEHTMMLSPKLSMAEIPQMKQHWETVANLLNSSAGANKSVKQWKEVRLSLF
jgi:hypothetical protein